MLGFLMFYSIYYGLPESLSKISPILFLPQMIGIYILIPLAVGQFILAFLNRGKPETNVIHYIYSGIIVIVCQFLYWVFASSGFIITN